MSIADKLYEKVEKISEDIGEMKVTLAKQESNIDHHIKRTDLAEESIGLLRQDLEPIKLHVRKIKFTAEILGYVAAIASFVAIVIGIINALS